MSYIPVELSWYGSFCQTCLVDYGASMSRDSLLTTTGKSNIPGLVLAFREAGSLFVEEEYFDIFLSTLTDEEFEEISTGRIRFL